MQTFASEGFLPLRSSFSEDRETFALALLLGIALGAVYDILRALRRGARLGSIAGNILDFFFALLFFFCFFVLSVARTGVMRFFTLAAMLAGAAAERFTLGRVIVKLFTRLFYALRGLFDASAGRLFAKIAQKTRSLFVNNKSNSKKFQKKPQKGLKLRRFCSIIYKTK